jgi:hypothetical protein
MKIPVDRSFCENVFGVYWRSMNNSEDGARQAFDDRGVPKENGFDWEMFLLELGSFHWHFCELYDLSP